MRNGPFMSKRRSKLALRRIDSSIGALGGQFLANLGLTYMVASVLALVIDSPVLHLVSMLPSSIGADRAQREVARAASDRHDTSSASDQLDASWTLGSPISSELTSPKDTRCKTRLSLSSSHEDLSGQALESMKPSRQAGSRSASRLDDMKSSSREAMSSKVLEMRPNHGKKLGAGYRYNNHHAMRRHDNKNDGHSLYDSSVLMKILSSQQQQQQQPKHCPANTPDPEFQQKLAKAISKGFRLRNQMAMGNAKASNHHHHQIRDPQVSCSKSETSPYQNQMKSLDSRTTSDEVDSGSSLIQKSSWVHKSRPTRTRCQLSTFVAKHRRDPAQVDMPRSEQNL